MQCVWKTTFGTTMEDDHKVVKGAVPSFVGYDDDNLPPVNDELEC